MPEPEQKTTFPVFIVVNGQQIPVNWLRLDAKVITKTKKVPVPLALQPFLGMEEEAEEKIMREVYVPVPPPQFATPGVMRAIYNSELLFSDDSGQSFSYMSPQDRIDFNLPIDVVANAIPKFAQKAVDVQIKNEFIKRGKQDWMSEPRVKDLIDRLSDEMGRGGIPDWDKMFKGIEADVEPWRDINRANVLRGRMFAPTEGESPFELEQLQATIEKFKPIAEQAMAKFESGEFKRGEIPSSLADQLEQAALEFYNQALQKQGEITSGQRRGGGVSPELQKAMEITGKGPTETASFAQEFYANPQNLNLPKFAPYNPALAYEKKIAELGFDPNATDVQTAGQARAGAWQREQGQRVAAEVSAQQTALMMAGQQAGGEQLPAPISPEEQARRARWAELVKRAREVSARPQKMVRI